ncbi:MAG: hypothetical protein KC416_17395, partial [Myxococcales bacterium]|nr:hypothetical protein [Myxococcales bacterium]
MTILSLVVLGLMWTGSAEAQRKRRRTPSKTTPTVQTAPPADAESSPAAGAVPEGGAPAGAEGTAEAGAPEDVAALPADSTPAAVPGAEASENGSGTELEAVASEFVTLMDAVVQLRSRVAVLGEMLFRTKVQVVLQNRAGDDLILERALLSLDGAPIFSLTDAPPGAEGRRVFSGFAAPGPHV